MFLLYSCFGFSQTITLKGVVKDSTATPLLYANVIAMPQDSTKNMTFAITDEVGRYKLLLFQESYTISISYLGYNTNSFKFDGKQDSTKDFILIPQENQLEEVIIELPIIVKQDTTIYNTDRFVTGDERKLKDVLKKLPGVEVDKNGGVTVNGKKITTMLVEGKKFFGGGSKLAVENIPADAIDKVEVIDNYNEIAFLKGLSDTDNMAMNIKLKEDKKNFVFGDIEAGKGNKDYYRAHSNLFYYSPKTNLNFIGNLNNVAEKTFTFKDYMSFQGGINAVLKGNGSIFKSSSSDFAQFMESKDVVRSTHQFGALNITQEVNSKLDITGYVIFSHNKNETLKQSINQYTDFIEDKSNRSNTKNLLGIGKIRIDYAPNSREQWYFNTQFKRSDNSGYNAILSEINTDINTINVARNSLSTYFNQNLEWHKKGSSKHTFSFAADYTFDKNNPKTRWDSNNPIYLLAQLKETQRNNFDAIFKHFWVLNTNNHIYTTIGNKFLKEYYVTSANQSDSNSTINFDDAQFNNNLDFKLNDLYVGLHYKFRTGIFTFKQGAYLHNYNWKVNQSTQVHENKWIVLPDFLTKIEFSKSKKIQLNYQLKSSFSDASKFANQFYLRSYNSVFKGNEHLENELYHSANMRYSRFSMYRGIMLYSGIRFTKKVKGIKNDVQFDGVNQILTPFLYDNPETRWSVYANLRKKIKNINYKVGVNYNDSKYVQNVDAIRYINKSKNTSFNISAKTLYENFPTIEIGYKMSLGNYTSSNSTSKFTTQEPFVTIDYDFLDGFIFSFDYNYYNYQNKDLNQKNTYDIGNATLSYRNEDSAWSFKIDAQNIFDVKFKNSNSFSSYIISDTKTYIMPRVLMFSIGYNL